MRTHCQSCGAAVDLHAEKCAYCGVPYPWKMEAPEPLTVEMDTEMLALAFHHNMITLNEARRRLRGADV